MTDESDFTRLARRLAVHSRRLRVIEGLMRGAHGVRLRVLCERYLLELRRG